MFLTLQFDYRENKAGEKPLQIPKVGLITLNELTKYTASPEQIIKKFKFDSTFGFLGNTPYLDNQFQLSSKFFPKQFTILHKEYTNQNIDVYFFNPEHVYSIGRIMVKDLMKQVIESETDIVSYESSVKRLLSYIIKSSDQNRKMVDHVSKLRETITQISLDLTKEKEITEKEKEIESNKKVYIEQYESIRSIYNFQNRHLELLLK